MIPGISPPTCTSTGASRVFIFDHTIRRAQSDMRAGATITLRGPVNRVHIDQSYSASKNRVPHHLPEEADRLLLTRYQIINVWRPIKPIYKDPLAVADGNTVPDDDLIGVGLIYPDRRGETYTVRPSEKHKWYYAYGQTPEEVMLIKCRGRALKSGLWFSMKMSLQSSTVLSSFHVLYEQLLNTSPGLLNSG